MAVRVGPYQRIVGVYWPMDEREYCITTIKIKPDGANSYISPLQSGTRDFQAPPRSFSYSTGDTIVTTSFVNNNKYDVLTYYDSNGALLNNSYGAATVEMPVFNGGLSPLGYLVDTITYPSWYVTIPLPYTGAWDSVSGVADPLFPTFSPGRGVFRVQGVGLDQNPQEKYIGSPDPVGFFRVIALPIGTIYVHPLDVTCGNITTEEGTVFSPIGVELTETPPGGGVGYYYYTCRVLLKRTT